MNFSNKNGDLDYSEQIYIKITSDHPEIFQNIQKNAPLINHYISQNTNDKFYLEVIENGLLYIYHDFSVFSLLNQPFTERQVRNFISKSEKFHEFRNIFPFYADGSSFPSEGIRIFFHTTSEPKEKIIQTGKSHFYSLFKDRVRISQELDGDLVLHITKVDDFTLYLSLIMSLLAGIFKKIEKANRNLPPSTPEMERYNISRRK